MQNLLALLHVAVAESACMVTNHVSYAQASLNRMLWQPCLYDKPSLVLLQLVAN